MALLVANNPAYEPIIKKARNFEIGLQDLRGDDVAISGGNGSRREPARLGGSTPG